MKVYKKNQHSLFVKPFGVQDKLYLALTVFIYFDLMAPDDPLTEQELWKTIPDQLKPTPLLDAGMPKPRGEVLLTGSCFSPRGTVRNASTVSFRVGELRKEIAVFGDRWWQKTKANVNIITDPVPFSELPLTWQNAFGGEDFPANPLGKGITPVLGKDGELRTPLPNIEYRDRIIGSPSDRPAPAGFDVVDMMRPQRQKKTGTYDDKWLKERWPYFPDDMDYEYFNCAPADQYIDAFFQGGEAIEILNMHPDMQLISSHLPELRIRCFVTKKEAPKSTVEVFQNVTTRVDTLWLFPTILRGVVMYRGTTEIYDEEYEDVLRIFIATERLKDQPLTLEHYQVEQKKAMDTTVTVDMAPLQEAAKKIGKMMKRVKKIPKDIDHSLKMATGHAPVMPRTPAETAAVGQQVIGDNLALLDRLEAQSRDLHGKYGHLAKIDLTMFERMRGSLRATSTRIGESLTHIEAVTAKVRQDATTALKAGAAKVRMNVPAALLDKAGFAPEGLLDQQKKINPWHDRGFPLVVQCRRNLEADRVALNSLHALGIEKDTIKRAWLGINPGEIKDSRAIWGLKPSPDAPKGIALKGDAASGDELVIPAGLVMPRFNEAVLNRILILPGNQQEDGGWQKDGDLAGCELVDGSDKTPLLFIAEDSAPVIAVTDELQALLLEQEIGDACSVIVLARPDEKPSKDGDAQIKGAEAFLVVMPEKAAPGAKDWEAWKKAYPDCLPYALPKGANLFAAARMGVDIRAWIMDALPKEFRKRHKIAPSLPEPGKHPTAEDLTVPIPAIDVKAIVDKSSKEIHGYLDGKMGDLVAKQGQVKAEHLARVGEALKKAGLNPDDVLKINSNPEPVSIAAAGDSMMAKLALGAAALKKQGTLTPDIQRKFSEMSADIKKMSQEGQARFDAGMAKLAAAKETAAAAKAKTLAQEMPPGAKATFAKFGMDTDRMVKRTREEVIAMHGRGESLAFARLAGVDLSGLDLSGIDLNQAQCQKTNFAGSILDGADFTQVMAMEADFTGASLQKSKLDKCMLIKAKLKKADLRAAVMNQATIKDADLTEADLSGSTIYMTTIMKTSLVKAKFNDVKANLSVFSDGDASDTAFKGARLERCLIRRLTLDRASFSQAALPSTTFMEVSGEGVSFYGADMHKTRMGNNSRLPGTDLRNVTFTQGSLRETDLSGSKFTGSCLDGALIEKCDLHDADLYGVCAKTCRFAKSNLEGAEMRHINLFCGSLRKSRLVNADLRGANLYAVDFYKAVFGATQMDDANVKKSLLFKRTDALRSEKGIT
ncbi:MAG: DUF2169 domain-containing protein [Deltaproteobacteria bacterium]|nr:DUF2169 domain-containing protein [Deltaproteobacteria bacterium]